MDNQPLYQTVANSIENRIMEGRYEVNEPLPPEPLLGEEFGVSRITIRKALGLLKRKGLLYSRSGKGTIVRSDALTSHAMKITCSIAELTYYAQSTVYQPLTCSHIPADAYFARHLMVPEDEDVLVLTGVRGQNDGSFFAYEEIYVPKPFSSGITNQHLVQRTIFGEIERHHGVTISEVHQTLTAVIPNEAVRSTLGLSKMACCLRAIRLYITRDGRPVEMAIVHYDSEKFEHYTTLYNT